MKHVRDFGVVHSLKDAALEKSRGELSARELYGTGKGSLAGKVE
jgi:hypothetical protein